ncbi:MAG: Nramp family divalent metal transporter [Planctomycetota bacterium]|jgi:Mn2+/Fe2+ NRAMP family transporter
MDSDENILPKVNCDSIPDGFDPYRLDPGDVQEPPATFWQTFRLLGPGMILAASIIGSGELIATTTLGAQVGYAALWVILLSCFIKPIIQEELGRHTIVSGVTTLESFNRIPGLKVFSVNWIVLAWAIMVLLTLLQVGAMFGGVAQVMHILVPAVSVNIWVLIFWGITLALLIGGGYDRIEGIAMIKVGFFTMLTILAAVLLMNMPKYFSWEGVIQGLRFKLPGAGLATAVAVLGITGVGTMEIVIYPYWCVEKGYARFTGVRDNSLDWQQRAKGWIRVMRIDIVVSVFVYTIATIAFYLLGAGVLHGMGLVPLSSEMIPTLSKIYTETLGGRSGTNHE